MRSNRQFILAAALAAVVLLAAAPPAAPQPPQPLTFTAGAAAGVDDLRRWDATVDALARSGELAVASRQADRMLPGRVHEYLAQYAGGVRVLGGGVARQLDGGVTVSLAGTVHRGIDIETTPALSADAAARRMEQAAGAALVAGVAPELIVLPLVDGTYALAWRAPLRNLRMVTVDAADGRVLRARDLRRTQAAVGSGRGVRGDRKKMSTSRAGGRYQARDRLRPGEIVTLDVRFEESSFQRLLFGADEPRWMASDIASDADNTWTDTAVVDHHVHVGLTYDYLSQVLSWNGMDNRNGRIWGMVNIDREWANAFFAPPPVGPEAGGVMAYGAIDGQPMVALDVVGHELGHGVIYYSAANRTGNQQDDLTDNLRITQRLGPRSYTDRNGRTHHCATTRFETVDMMFQPTTGPAICRDGRFVLASYQSGAIHEAYADILAEATAFHHAAAAGTKGDYLQGSEGEVIGVLRSMRDPRSLGHPAAYANRREFALVQSVLGADFSGEMFVDGKYEGTLEGGGGYGAEHWNSLIISHAYFLAVEGGTNAATGITVAGAGAANRQQIEKILFRALVQVMPIQTSLPQLADAIRQSAADMAAGSAVQRALEDALRAVGLPPGA